MIDTYLCACDLSLLKSLCDRLVNVIGPVQGRCACAEKTLADGEIVQAVKTAGDPEKYYICVRTDEAIALCAGIEICEPSVGQAVCGVWS